MYRRMLAMIPELWSRTFTLKPATTNWFHPGINKRILTEGVRPELFKHGILLMLLAL